MGELQANNPFNLPVQGKLESRQRVVSLAPCFPLLLCIDVFAIAQGSLEYESNVRVRGEHETRLPVSLSFSPAWFYPIPAKPGTQHTSHGCSPFLPTTAA